MAEMMNVKTASAVWNMEERKITVLCREKHIPGAIKQGKNWLIPTNAEKPEDRRVKSGAYKKVKKETRRPSQSASPIIDLHLRSIIILTKL